MEHLESLPGDLYNEYAALIVNFDGDGALEGLFTISQAVGVHAPLDSDWVNEDPLAAPG